MLNFILDTFVAACAVMFVWYMVRAHLRFSQKNSQTDPVVIDDYLQKFTQVTGISAYDTFFISAEDWSVSADRINQDFRRYLSTQSVPFYVKDFVRKGQPHIDELYRGKGGSYSDKRMLLFYFALILFFWGGAFFVSLYVIPYIWPEAFRASIHLGPP
jgi:hypothetical protein